MAEIAIQTESESGNGWTFHVQITDDGRTHEYDVTLSWSDYDHWSRGQVAPERVVEAAMAFLLEREPATAILPRFDCAVIRRYFPEVDRKLPKLL